MAVNSYVTYLEKLEQHQLGVDAARCITVRNRNVVCNRCAQACAGGCIQLIQNQATEYELSINPKKCIGCGTCATSCPTGALIPRQPDDHALAREAASCMRATGGQVVFACADIYQAAQELINPDTVVGVPCVGRIDESLLAILVVSGAQSIRLVTGKCAECPHRNGVACAQKVCDTANTLFAAWQSEVRVQIATRFPPECRKDTHSAQYDQARREFLFAMKSEVAGAARDALDMSIDKFFDVQRPAPQHYHVTTDGTMPHFVPRRRQLLLDALEDMGTPADELIETRLWGHVIIKSDMCDSCRMCAVFCPSGALSKLVDEGVEVGLVHAPGYCLKCRTCEQVCPKGALSLSDEVFAQDLNAGIVERFDLARQSILEGDPDAIRKAMQQKINSPYIWG